MLSTHQRRVLERAGEKEIVGSALADGDSHARAIDLGIARNARIRPHRIDALDEHIGRGEIDLGRTRRLDRQEADVAVCRLHRFERLAGAVDRDDLELDAEPVGERAGEIDRDARRHAGGVKLHQHRIADIDGGAQPAGRGEFLHELGWNAGHKCLHQIRSDGPPPGCSRCCCSIPQAASLRLAFGNKSLDTRKELRPGYP